MNVIERNLAELSCYAKRASARTHENTARCILSSNFYGPGEKVVLVAVESA